jgi:hypothetical protein
VIDPANVAPEFRVDQAARGYDLWHDRHGNFFPWRNQWFYIFNDKSQPGTHTHFRNSCLAYVHYRDNGEIAPIRLDRIGVGQFDARQRIEAEDYFGAEQAEVREHSDGFEVRGLKRGSHLLYPNVRNLPSDASLEFRVASAGAGPGRIEVRANSSTGEVLGSCGIPSTGAWNQYQTIRCRLKAPGGKRSLCFTFDGDAGEVLRLDWWTVSPTQ